ncbi:winged helix-turn-helix transcriptional regulator [Pseudomonas nitroreducens]|uniref:winged helix-turn-helix transcriptional regulator n=1 Tax=Pseudomonas nitroreducens TaxID=46680 RepID=UPI0026589CFD|nr:helix-turn-helix domain-containing protein [Pseudomonas nitroreducens]MCP1649649.1 DNA-binding HxlR family transcriptional regulator [Pseudomonas nitroreducens]MCP1687623.1 DNA-binding HxlR family transcriptional regulator [Pseudomonas nitroreducens]
MRRSSFENLPCPVAQALDLIGDSWNVLILREAFYGSTRFDQFHARLGIASNVLTRRLRALVDSGLLQRRQYHDHPPRFEYLLTDRGRDLRPVLLTLLQWGQRHAAMATAAELVDTRTGQPVRIVLVDADSGEAIGAHHQIHRREGDQLVPVFPQTVSQADHA